MIELITQSAPHLLHLKARAAGYPVDQAIPLAGLYDSRTGRMLTDAGRYWRDWHISAWNPATRKWLELTSTRAQTYSVRHRSGYSFIRFDTWNSPNRSEAQLAFTEVYASIPVGFRVLIVGNHAPSHFSNNMRSSLIDAGGTLDKTNWQGGSAPGASGWPTYILLGTKGIGEGKAEIEVINNLPAINNQGVSEITFTL